MGQVNACVASTANPLLADIKMFTSITIKPKGCNLQIFSRWGHYDYILYSTLIVMQHNLTHPNDEMASDPHVDYQPYILIGNTLLSATAVAAPFMPNLQMFTARR